MRSTMMRYRLLSGLIVYQWYAHLAPSPILTPANTPPPQLPTSPPRKSSLSNAVRRLSIAGLRGRRKVSAGNSQAPSGAATPALDGTFELGSPVDVDVEVGRA